MKQRIIFALFAATTLLLASCVRDNLDVDPKGGDEDGYATLSFDPRFGDHGTRAEWWGDDVTDPFPEGNAADIKIGTFRVLVYNHATGALVTPSAGRSWNFLFQYSETNKPPFKVRIPAGNTAYDFVFIANEHTPNTTGGNSIFGVEGSSAASFDTFDELYALTLDHADDIAGDKDIPMVNVIRNVKVASSSEITVGGTIKNIATSWVVDLYRAAIRLSVKITMSEARYSAWKTFHQGDPYPYITFDGFRSRSYVMPPTAAHGQYNDASGSALSSVVPAFVTVPSAPDALFAPAVQRGEYGSIIERADGSAEVRIDRLIYPEIVFEDETLSSKAVEMSIGFNGRIYSEIKSALIFRSFTDSDDDGEWDDPLTDDYTMPRNTWLVVEADIENDMKVTTRVLPWNNVVLDNVDGSTYHLTTDRSFVPFPGDGGTETVEVFTDHPSGWSADLTGAPSWVTSVTPTAGDTGETTKLEIKTAGSTSAKIQKWSFDLAAGNLTRKITLILLPDGSVVSDFPTPPANVSMYVGAFWKSDQYGERLIRIERPSINHSTGVALSATAKRAIDGEWAAMVIEGEDWIVLDKKPTTDPGVYWTGTGNEDVANGNDADFDARHRVNSTETTVMGVVSEAEPQIYFRIGLNGTIAPDEHRYGVVLLIYTNAGATKFHRIFVRQGESADYLMRPEDPATGLTSREKASMFLPYNLTASEFRAGTASENESPVVATRGGALTEYPSQAGALFQWAPYYGIYAFNPVNPSTGNPVNWQQGQSVYGIWGNTEERYESCPPGYRRPNDGPGGDSYGEIPNNSDYEIILENAEFAQSLNNVPHAGGFEGSANEQNENDIVEDLSNSSWGYYADGYFDRRPITLVPDVSSTGKAIPSSSVAADGYAAAYQGRLHFNPHNNASLFLPAAGRRPGTTGMVDNGVEGNYWSSTLHAYSGAWTYNVTAYHAGRLAVGNAAGQSIRCVVDRGLVSVASHEFEYGGGRHDLVVKSTDASGTETGWEIVGYRIGKTGPFSTTSPDWLVVDVSNDGDDNTTPYVAVHARPSTVANPDDITLRSRPVIADGASASSPHDLSYGHAPNPLQQNTANSYVIGAPGYYKLPLVYGNAVKNGTSNTAAYSNTGGALGNFKNHADADIASPFIDAMVPNGPGERKNATLVWQDTPGLVIVDPVIEGTGSNAYLSFEVPAENISQGNAVVAVRDADDVILWSWHIWVTPFDLGTTDAVTNRAGYTSEFMRYNLGWISGRSNTYETGNRIAQVMVRQTGTPDPQSTVFSVLQREGVPTTMEDNAPYWQWGRKDPIPPGDGITARADQNARELFYDDTAYRFIWTSVGLAGTLGGVIKNPNNFFGNTSPYVSQLDTYYNLWDAPNTGQGIETDNDVVKTVYDPSPIGFKMPPANVWTGFMKDPLTGSGWGTRYGAPSSPAGFNDGYRFYLDPANPSKGTTALFPAISERNHSVGGGGFGTMGRYWSALPVGSLGYHMTLTSSGVYAPSNSDVTKNSGLQVRPVRDEAPTYSPLGGGIPAPPGVIGYYENGDSYELTLQGSSHYKNTPVGTAAAAAGAPVADYPVWVAYFKWGSLVALDSSDENSTFTSADIVKVPSDGYMTMADLKLNVDGAGTPNLKWAAVPHDTRTPTPSGWPDNFPAGLGDPCKYYFDNWQGVDWRLPTSVAAEGWNGGTPFENSNVPWPVNGGHWVPAGGTQNLPVIGAVGGDGSSEDWSMFFPSAGHRNSSQGYIEEYNVDTGGYYWSSTAVSSSGYTLRLTEDYVIPGSPYGTAWGKPIRCVNCDPVEGVSVSRSPSGTLEAGTTVTMTASVTGNKIKASGALYHWQSSTNGSTWIDIPGAKGKTYTTVVDETNSRFRVAVTKCGGSPVYVQLSISVSDWNDGGGSIEL